MNLTGSLDQHNESGNGEPHAVTWATQLPLVRVWGKFFDYERFRCVPMAGVNGTVHRLVRHLLRLRFAKGRLRATRYSRDS